MIRARELLSHIIKSEKDDELLLFHALSLLHFVCSYMVDFSDAETYFKRAQTLLVKMGSSSKTSELKDFLDFQRCSHWQHQGKFLKIKDWHAH